MENLVGQLERLHEHQHELREHQHELHERLAELHERLAELHKRLEATELELALARQRIGEFEGSVIVGIVRSLSARFYRLVPEESRLGRLVQASLRLIGRTFLQRASNG
jgi:predicted  nucleic acid-binding Zn-ribbon protein